jgi:predicted DsbA family dithiol-disulfide isomerase
MQLTVLAVPGCPNARVLEQRLAGLLAGRPEVTMTRRVIADAAEAARWGMRGSPTLLVDGQDPFAGSGSGAVVACRLYRDEQGRLDGAPTVSALRDVLERAGARD